MADWILISVAALLAGLAFWLRRLVKEKSVAYTLEARLEPEANVRYVELAFGAEDEHTDSPRRILAYYGLISLPEKVYENDSQNISIDLRPAFDIQSLAGEHLRIRNVRIGKSITLSFEQQDSQDHFLEVEFLGAGISIDGEKKQRQKAASKNLVFKWNCYFGNSGDHIVDLTFRVVTLNDMIELGSIQHKVKVVKLDHLTQRQVWILAALAATISGVVVGAEALHQIGVW